MSILSMNWTQLFGSLQFWEDLFENRQFLQMVLNSLILNMPCRLLAYLPFQNHLRKPFWKILIPVVCVQLIHAILYAAAVLYHGPDKLIFYGFMPVYLGLYLFYIQDDPFKILFWFILTMDCVMIFRGLALFLQARFFQDHNGVFVVWSRMASL